MAGLVPAIHAVPHGARVQGKHGRAFLVGAARLDADRAWRNDAVGLPVGGFATLRFDLDAPP